MGVRDLLRRKRAQPAAEGGAAEDAPAEAPETEGEEGVEEAKEAGERSGSEAGDSDDEEEEEEEDEEEGAESGGQRRGLLARLRRKKAKGGSQEEEAAKKEDDAPAKGTKKKQKRKKGKKKGKKGKRKKKKSKKKAGVIGRLVAIKQRGRGDNALARMLFGGIRVGSADRLPLELPVYFAPRVPDPVLRDIWWCARKGALDDVRFFLESGTYSADSRRDPSSAGQTPLHWAAAGGRVAVADLLKQHGADVSKPDRSGDLPLHVACWSGQTAMAAWCVTNGKLEDISALNKDAGLTPLHLARMRGHEDLLVRLEPVIDRKWIGCLAEDILDKIIDKRYQYEKKRFELMVSKELAAEEREAKLKEWEEKEKEAQEAADRAARHARGEFTPPGSDSEGEDAELQGIIDDHDEAEARAKGLLDSDDEDFDPDGTHAQEQQYAEYGAGYDGGYGEEAPVDEDLGGEEDPEGYG